MKIILAKDEAKRALEEQFRKDYDEIIVVEIDLPTPLPPQSQSYSAIENVLKILDNLKSTTFLADNKIKFIKLIRDMTGCGLVDAKRAIEVSYETSTTYYNTHNNSFEGIAAVYPI